MRPAVRGLIPENVLIDDNQSFQTRATTAFKADETELKKNRTQIQCTELSCLTMYVQWWLRLNFIKIG